MPGIEPATALPSGSHSQSIASPTQIDSRKRRHFSNNDILNTDKNIT